ncbi:hypothetical protein NQ315_012920, partial [Exocentrus adspersus]
SSDSPRTCILVKKHLNILPSTNFCFRDLVAVKIKGEGKAMPKDISKWHVSDEESCSDHRYINFIIGGLTCIQKTSEPAKDQLESIQNRPRHWSEGDNKDDKEQHRT